MKWINKTDEFTKRNYNDKYLEICEVLDDKIEVNLYSCEDISNYEIYVSYGVMYGIVYVHKNEAEKLRNKIKQEIYDDYIRNGYSKDLPTDKFINNFYNKYKITIPSDIFFDEEKFMNDLLNIFG